MNLIVDVGNTRIKIAVFKETTLVHKEICTNETFFTVIKKAQESYDIQFAMVSSVGNLEEGNLLYLTNHFSCHQLSHKSLLPFENKYSTPKTLGVDRIALASAACLHFPNENTLIIDAGSCITYDFVTAENHYLGGAIAPGITMRYKAVHTFTANLPLLEKEMPNNYIGDTTENAIHVGISQAVVQEIHGFISQYEKKYSPLQIILTGGDTNFLRDRLKNDIFANSNFLLEGLNYILEINKD